MDDDDILVCRNSFIGQANRFFCNFPMLDVENKNSLFKVYCSSHYGSELWNLTDNNIEDYCIAWMKSLRRLWSLPYNSSKLSTVLTPFTVPLFDEICCHIKNFIYSCFHSDSHFICSVVLHGIHVSRTYSPIGRNAAFCSLHYDTRIDNLFDTKLTKFLHVLNPSYLQIYLHAPMLYVRLYWLETVSALSNANHLSINELNYLLEWLAIDLS